MTDQHQAPESQTDEQKVEPFGYFRPEPFGWTDCAATDEGAIALYERPAAPAVPQGEPVAQVSDLFPSIRTKLCEMGFEPESPLYTAPAATSHPAVPGVELRPEDFTVEVIVTPMGGFAPNVTHGVRVTHKPTGLSASCDTERSQHRNRQIAFEQIKAMLTDLFKITPQSPATPSQEPVTLTDEADRRSAFDTLPDDYESPH